MPLNRIPFPSPNYASRGGATVRLIVLHTAEGATTIQSLGAYFANPSNQVSSHVGIDDTPATVGEYVRPVDGSAWTAANANPVAVQAELCAFASWDIAEWNRHPNMLANCAAWIAEEAARFGIGIVRLTAAQAQGGGAGVCQHVDLGSWGGGHVDCGGSFPMAQVLEMAAGGGAPGPEPEPPGYFSNGAQEDDVMAVCTHPDGKRVDMVVVGVDQTVWHYFANDGDLTKPDHSEQLGGKAKAVSACWQDGGRFTVMAHGTPNKDGQEGAFQKVYDGKEWGEWKGVPGVVLWSG